MKISKFQIFNQSQSQSHCVVLITISCTLILLAATASGQLLASLNPNEASLVDYYARADEAPWKLPLLFNTVRQPAESSGQRVYYNLDDSHRAGPEEAVLLLNDKNLIEFYAAAAAEDDVVNRNKDKNLPMMIMGETESEPQTEAEPDILEPVNNPIEFSLESDDVKLKNKSELLDSLLSVYMNTMLARELHKEQQLAEEKANLNQLDQFLAARSVSTEISQTTEEDEDRIGASYGRTSPGGEYIDHPLALAGHQYVQGGAGEGRQLLGPDGSFENVQVVKSDRAVPSYCDPPNPCPIGFTAEDGCLENFVNSASFSREYQAKQKCSCDNEHSLFNCAVDPAADAAATGTTSGDFQSPSENQLGGTTGTSPSGSLEALARTVSNRFGDLASIRSLISSSSTGQEENQGIVD